jgi:hypothetical protein
MNENGSTRLIVEIVIAAILLYIFWQEFGSRILSGASGAGGTGGSGGGCGGCAGCGGGASAAKPGCPPSSTPPATFPNPSQFPTGSFDGGPFVRISVAEPPQSSYLSASGNSILGG